MKSWMLTLAKGCVCLILGMSGAWGHDAIVEKKVFTLPSYTTVAGKTIRNVRVGYETYGRLNAQGDNAIFIAHFYSGNSHAAGKYKDSDPAPGYWDSIIGSGKPIDTDKYFVVSADTLANLNTKDPMTITTGPSSIDPETGAPYGMRFPMIAMRDSVRVHKALTDSLGIKKFKAVAGASGGSVQAMEWGVLYGEQVERVIHVIGPGFSISPWVIGLLDLWVDPIKVDPKWNNGDYYGRDEPVDGLAMALKIVTLTAGHWGWADKSFGYQWADATQDPALSMEQQFKIEDVLQKTAAARARSTDANHSIYMAKANQLYNVEKEIGQIKAKILFLPAASDLVFPPEFARKAANQFQSQGGRAEVFVIEGDRGHLDGVLGIAKAGPVIRDFLSSQ